MRLSMPRLINNLFQNQANQNTSILVLTTLLTNGSLFKHEIIELLTKVNGCKKAEVENAIV